MATYQDIHRIIKETIQVDADFAKRWTPQLVKFINHDNEFYGNFYGKIDATEFFASNCHLSNAELSNCKLYDLSGNELDLNSILEKFNALDTKVTRLSSSLEYDEQQIYTNLPLSIYGLCSYVNEVSTDLSILMDKKIEESGKGGSKELQEISTILHTEISTETLERKNTDNFLYGKILDLSGCVRGGLVYRGMVAADVPYVDTFSQLINQVESIKGSNTVRSGYMYLVHSDVERYIEEKKLNNGDYIVVNLSNGTLPSIKVSEISRDDVDIMDAMDAQVYTLINNLSANVSSLTLSVEGFASTVQSLSTTVEELKDLSSTQQKEIQDLQSRVLCVETFLSTYTLIQQ